MSWREFAERDEDGAPIRPDAFETGEDDRPGPPPYHGPKRGVCPECHVLNGTIHHDGCSRPTDRTEAAR